MNILINIKRVRYGSVWIKMGIWFLCFLIGGAFIKTSEQLQEQHLNEDQFSTVTVRIVEKHIEDHDITKKLRDREKHKYYFFLVEYGKIRRDVKVSEGDYKQKQIGDTMEVYTIDDTEFSVEKRDLVEKTYGEIGCLSFGGIVCFLIPICWFVLPILWEVDPKIRKYEEQSRRRKEKNNILKHTGHGKESRYFTKEKKK